MDKKFVVDRKVEITKEEYITHLEEKAVYWRKRNAEVEKEQERALATYKNKQQKRLLEIQMIEHRIKLELKELKGNK